MVAGGFDPTIINGGIKTLDECDEHLRHVDGVMIGREAYQNPYMMAEVDQRLYHSDSTPLSRKTVLEQMLPYVEQQLADGRYLNHITRHLLGLFHSQRGGRQFRRYLSENAHKPGASVDTLKEALNRIPD